jgi:peptide/nickel transport system substrate-binding protein
MFKHKRWVVFTALLLLIVVALAACQPQVEERVVEVTRVVTETVEVEGEQVEVTRVVTETVEVTPEAEEEMAEPVSKDLIICTAQEPDTLYYHGTDMLAARGVQHGLYEDQYTTRSFAYQPFGLAKLPSISDGDAVINEVEANAGDMVVDAEGNPVTLEEGVVVINAEGEEITFDGSTPVMLEQMVVDFEFNPLVWEDGTPVTADDSVYGFEVESAPETATGKFTEDRTASYEATGDLTTRWTGLPGFKDSTYFLNAWLPLPRHAWGEYTAAELLEAEEVNRTPLSDGPFKVEEWVAGDSITLVKNENYWREGYPLLDSVTYKFIPDTNQLIAQLLSGQCDIGTQDGMDVGQSPFLIEAESQGLLVPYFQTGTVYEHIDFAIDAIDEYASTRPDWFEDARVRQAMTMCTDRQSMVDNILYGRSEVIHTYIPSVHPLYPEGLTEWPFDVEQANALLDEVGFVDNDGDGVREYYAGEDLAGADSQWDGTPFIVTLGTTSGNEMRQQLTQIFKENLAECGVQVDLYYLPSSEWFADGPEGPLFGRKYDLGEFAWLTGIEPACDLYAGFLIPGPPDATDADGNLLYPSGWGGQNETGYRNDEYDAVCNTALSSLPGTPEYEEAHKEAQRIFSQDVPVIPLFLRLKVAAALPSVQNFGVDPTQNSELWNLYELDLGE